MEEVHGKNTNRIRSRRTRKPKKQMGEKAGRLDRDLHKDLRGRRLFYL
jgi:hypothetical protein